MTTRVTAPLAPAVLNVEHRLFDGPEGKGIEIQGWTFTATKGHILKADVVDDWQERLGTKNLPEMVFGQNKLSLVHSSGFNVEFNPFDALALVDKAKVLPKVAASQKWIASKTDNQLDGMSVYQYDWSYSSNYKGTLRYLGNNTTEAGTKEEEPYRVSVSKTDRIDMERLKRPDPILYFDEIHLYEDELDDNGVSIMSVKVRVMPSCFLVLLRFWLRIDHVMFHLQDTRIYHEFGTKHLVREVQIRESPYETLAKMMPNDKQKFSDPNMVSPMLPLKSNVVERIDILAGSS